MKRLDNNFWRLGWVLLINSVVIVLFLIGPIRAHHDQQLLYQVMGANPPPFSYIHEFLASPWVCVLLLALIVGMTAELRRSMISPIVNVGIYVSWLVVALWERAEVAGEATPYELSLGKVLLITPLTVVIAIDLIFYIMACRRRLDTPS